MEDLKEEARILEEFFSSPICPHSYLLLFNALCNKKIDPNLAITRVLHHTEDKRIVPMLGMCLRSGADPNVYVKTPGYGTVHLLAYASNVVCDPVLRDTVIILLVLAGARPTMSIFENSNTRASVISWLQADGKGDIYYSIRGVEDVYENVDCETVYDLSVILGKDVSSLSGNSGWRLSSNSFSSPEGLPRPDGRELRTAIHFCNENAYSRMLEEGVVPDYDTVNRILISMERYEREGVTEAVIALSSMLLRTIDLGYPLDLEQMSIVRRVGEGVVRSVEEHYKVPLWRKICRRRTVSPSLFSRRLKYILCSLDVDPTYPFPCDSLSHLSSVDPEISKSNIRERKRSLISLLNSHPDDGSSLRDGTEVKNRSSLSVDPYQVGKWQISTYRDDRFVWAFTCETFERLISTRRNPHNSDPLPEACVQDMICKSKILESWGLERSKVPLSSDEAIGELSLPDEISDDSEILSDLSDLAVSRSVGSTLLRKADGKTLSGAAEAAHLDVSLADLSDRHALITIAHSLIAARPDEVDDFFLHLRR